MIYKKEVCEKYNVDVFVAGGGAAGVAAAIAATRQGKTVFLAEKTGAFGGLGTSGLVPAFATFDDGENVLAAGIGYEIRKLVSKAIPLKEYWTTIDAEELKRVYDKMVTDEGVKFSFFTTLCDVIVNDGSVEGALLYSKSGFFTVKAKVYIDCTGDGDLCVMAGADFEKGDENGFVMPPTLCSTWANIDFETAAGEKATQNAYIEKAYKDGVLSNEDRHLPGFFLNENGIGCGNIGHIFDCNPLDEVSLTKSMIWGRKLLLEYERYYKEYHQGYENMHLVTTASLLGVRESRRIVCDYMLNGEDFRKRSVFEDEIGRYCYPVDIHIMNTDKEEYERFEKEFTEEMCYKKGESYGIPYRSLIPKRLKNVLVAGRCIGTDRKMQASIRVMPGCFITGQAAGVAAAIASSNNQNVRDVSLKELQKGLKDIGAYLPNAK